VFNDYSIIQLTAVIWEGYLTIDMWQGEFRDETSFLIFVAGILAWSMQD
jgi:hypothetical protein